MTTAPTPADRLDALCDALAARLRRGPDAEALHPLHDLATIVRDLHKGTQGAPGAPEATPEGDGTTTPVSGRETGAQRPRPGDRVAIAGSPHTGIIWWSINDDDYQGAHVIIDGDGLGVWVEAESLVLLSPVEPDAAEPPARELDDDARQPAPLCTDPLCPYAEAHKHENGATIAAEMGGLRGLGVARVFDAGSGA